MSKLCEKPTHVYAMGDADESPCVRKHQHGGLCCADRGVAHYLDQPVAPNRCPACPRFQGGVCPLCECGLTPMPGLNPEFIVELAGFLRAGSHELGRRSGESVLGHAIRIVRDRARVVTTRSLHETE